MSAIDVFHSDADRPSFEDFAKENGTTSWFASDLMKFLDYASFSTFEKAIQRAMTVCVSLGLKIQENFQQVFDGNGNAIDWKLTRFACYLTAMNGDVRKPEVAKAQAYFATYAEVCRKYVMEVEAVDRIQIRDEISDTEKSLISSAAKAGVTNYSFFQNAGYRGMYNMNISQLRALKGVPAGRSPLDFMGKAELAANQFRITQTEQKIRNQGLRGDKLLQKTAEEVGKEVRKTMLKISGEKPEDLAPAEDIQQVKKGLKGAAKEFKQVENSKPKRKKGN